MSRRLAWAWLALTLLLGAWTALSYQHLIARLNVDLFALLPRDEHDSRAEAALQRLAEQGERQLVLLVSAPDLAEAGAASRTLEAALKPLPLAEQHGAFDPAGVRDFFLPYRDGLVAHADAEALAKQPPVYWVRRAASAAFTPVSAIGLRWQQDPFELFTHWLLERAQSSPVRPDGDRLIVSEGGRHHAVLIYRIEGSAFSLALQERIHDGVNASIAELAKSHPQARVRRAGVVVHAATAARNAQSEVSLIGTGSTIGVVLLSLLAFRGWWRLVLLMVPIAVGSLWAVALTAAVFDQLHMITLVFGSSLIGVAVDYAEYAYCASLDGDKDPRVRYRELAPGMAVALATTVLAYLGLLLTPFPGLAQMAAFSAIGIIAAWLCVMLWFPFIGPRSVQPGPATRLFEWCGARWPVWRANRRGWVLLLLGAIAMAPGIYLLRANDDVRALAVTDPALLAEHTDVARALRLPSPAQLFVVSGRDENEVLVREEALTARLSAMQAEGRLAGFEAISAWVPSASRQHALWQLGAPLHSDAVLAPLREALELDAEWTPPPATDRILHVDDALASPLGPLLRGLWLGRGSDGRYASVVLLKGLSGQADSARLAAMAGEGVRWVDKPAEISELFGRYRVRLGWMVAIAYLLTFPLLWLRYRERTWRLWLPVALAAGGTLAIFGMAGVPVQLLVVLGLLLVLGTGVDYGVFIDELHGRPRAFVAVSLAAIATMISFGLLALSSTPALRAFGLTILVGNGLVWLLAPCFRHTRSAR